MIDSNHHPKTPLVVLSAGGHTERDRADRYGRIGAHPYLAAASIASGIALAAAGGLLVGAHRRRPLIDIVMGWF